MQENDAWFQRDDGSCPEWTKLFLEKLDEASILSGRRLNVARDQKQYMIDAGFVNVHDEIFRVGWFFFIFVCSTYDNALIDAATPEPVA